MSEHLNDFVLVRKELRQWVIFETDYELLDIQVDSPRLLAFVNRLFQLLFELEVHSAQWHF